MIQQFDYLPGPCLRSSHCCKTTACRFGEWDAAKHQCRFLEVSESRRCLNRTVPHSIPLLVAAVVTRTRCFSGC